MRTFAGVGIDTLKRMRRAAMDAAQQRRRTEAKRFRKRCKHRRVTHDPGGWECLDCGHGEPWAEGEDE